MVKWRRTVSLKRNFENGSIGNWEEVSKNRKKLKRVQAMYYTKLNSKLSENIFGILIQFLADLVIFTEEILNGKLYCLSSANFKVELSPSKIIVFICFNESSCRKRLDEKAKVSFIACDGTNWTSNNCNTNIAQYLKK